MARYGNDFYGLSFYGTDALVEFDASPFIASSVDYNRIDLSWRFPTGDWDVFRLVRNTFGFPVTPDDGDILRELLPTSDERDYIDTGQVPNNSNLIEGQTYYYSIFVRDSSNDVWYKAGDALAVSVKNYGTAQLMYDYLPTIYKISNTYTALDNDPGFNPDLYGFLQIFAFEYDLFKTVTENALNRYDVLKLDGRLVPVLLNQFGFNFEQELGLQQARVLLKNAIKIYSERGSLSGIKTYTTAFTGFNCDVRKPTNLMLGLNDSSFREALGFWQSRANAELVRGTLTSETPAIDPYQEPLSPSNYPNSQLGFLRVTAEADGDMELVCGDDSIRKKAIPVEPGVQYTLSTYSRAKTDERNVVVDILWYSLYEDFLGTAGEANYTNAVGSWTRSPGATGTAPATARFAVPYIRIEDCDEDEVHYIDAVQFEVGPTPTTFTDARRIDVVLKANRINEILNPSFEVDFDTWEITGATASIETEVIGSGTPITPETPIYGGDNLIELTATEEVCQLFTDYGLPVISNDQHAASIYVKGDSGNTVKLVIRWLNEALIETDFTESDLGELNGEWQRLFIEAVAPNDAKFAKMVVIFDGDIGDTYQADAALFEKAAYVLPYFDGSAGYAQIGDLVWEGGVAHAGRSHYYKNRESATIRLRDTLQDYIPTGSSWAVFVAQPD